LSLALILLKIEIYQFQVRENKYAKEAVSKGLCHGGKKTTFETAPFSAYGFLAISNSIWIM
jgi:hypothetical protein